MAPAQLFEESTKADVDTRLGRGDIDAATAEHENAKGDAQTCADDNIYDFYHWSLQLQIIYRQKRPFFFYFLDTLCKTHTPIGMNTNNFPLP